jgi:uroporphyrinogen decarboxylase
LKTFEPDYTNIVDAAYNRKPKRLPIYDHVISGTKYDDILGHKISGLPNGNYKDKVEFFRQAGNCLVKLGYDIYPAEHCINNYIQGGRGLIGKAPPLIRTEKDLEKFPWDAVADKFIEESDPWFLALKEALPPGMKAAGGVGNGVFEIAQDFVPYTELVYLKSDNPELYAALFKKVGDLMAAIWSRFLEKHADLFVILRFGDDLGFKTGPLLSPEDIKELIIPQYKRIVDIVHKAKRPFLLHSCGKIFEVMDDIISVAGINAKHSNEDAIAPFSEWTDRYGSRIGLFGGVDMNIICLEKPDRIKKIVAEIIKSAKNARGLAIGCGNSIPDYVPTEGYVAMCEAIREYDWK